MPMDEYQWHSDALRASSKSASSLNHKYNLVQHKGSRHEKNTSLESVKALSLSFPHYLPGSLVGLRFLAVDTF